MTDIYRESVFFEDSTAAVRDAWIQWGHELVEGYPTWFVTITHEKFDTHPEASRRMRNHWLNQLNKEIFGNHYDRKGLGLASIFVLEHQRRGTVHQHGIVAGSELDRIDPEGQQIYLASIAAGVCKIAVPRSSRRVVRYCLKRSHMGAEIDMWLPRLR